MKKNIVKVVVFLLWLSYIAMLFWLLFKPISQEQSKLLVGLWLKYFSNLPFEADKAIHFCLFTPLPLLTYLSSIFIKIKYKLLWVSLFCIFISTFTEIVQSYLPYRSYDVRDLIADYIGISIGLIIVLIIVLITKIRAGGHHNRQGNEGLKKS